MIIRTAFATSDGQNIDRHFGAADRFDIYEINTDKEDYKRVDVREVDKACLNHEHHDERMEAVTEEISDCHAVFEVRNRARTVLERRGSGNRYGRPINVVIRISSMAE